MTPPKAILFDLGNVLVSIHPDAFAAHLGIDQGAAKAKYQQAVMTAVRRYESGEITTEDFLNRLTRLFEGKYTREEVRQGMLKVIGKPILGMDSVIQAVASTTTAALVSNTNELHFTYCMNLFPMLRHFHHFFLSYELRVMKPNPLYYKRVLERLRAGPESVVFVDDLEENVRGAQSEGMTGILFTTPEDLRSTLRNLGVRTTQ